MLEIDGRTIQGNGGEVSWLFDGGTHVITVTDAQGTVQARFHSTDGREARELFEHPFARAVVPNLFDRTPAAV